MKVYFVRHGETEANRKNFAQDEKGALSELGRQQAEFVGKRFKNIPIDLIVSSPYLRAKETTEIIHKSCNKEILWSELFVERRDPSVMVGKDMSSPESKAITKEIRANRHIPDWRHSNEETFTEIKERAKKALLYLRDLKKERILVVTHSGFLRSLLCAMIFGDTLTAEMYNKMFALRTINTGITLAEYSEHDTWVGSGWVVNAWNDHAHLGEIK
ncbi:histidine phosphatase family protein [Candidatus Parcubacteria bacterium]|nr:histidine phosphatase family protein [Candidatus Parcubacteria bacterium]